MFPSEIDYLVALATVCLDLPVTEPFLRHLIAHPGALLSDLGHCPLQISVAEAVFLVMEKTSSLSSAPVVKFRGQK